MKPILQHAINVEGGKSRLARALSVHPASVTLWASNLPLVREEQLERLYGRRKVKQAWKPKEGSK